MPETQAAEELLPRLTPPVYTPNDWYWLREDGAVFSSDRSNVVAGSDPDYLAWASLGRRATPWPRDDSGAQSVEALRSVLPAGLYASLDDYAATALTAAQAAGVMVGEVRVPTDLDSQNRLTNAYTFANLSKSKTVSYVDATGPVKLTVAEAEARIIAIGQHMQACTDKAEAVAASIASGKIRARSGVDKAFAELKD